MVAMTAHGMGVWWMNNGWKHSGCVLDMDCYVIGDERLG